VTEEEAKIIIKRNIKKAILEHSPTYTGLSCLCGSSTRLIKNNKCEECFNRTKEIRNKRVANPHQIINNITTPFDDPHYQTPK
jgi:hypothetical protein